MSGLFKNFDRIVCHSKFSVPNHNYIVKSFLHNFSPAALYYTPGEQLQTGHGKNIFELSLVSYQLQRQNSMNQEMLANVSQTEQTSFYNEISENLDQNNNYINKALNDIHLQFSEGVNTEQPLEALTSYTYTLGQQQQAQRESNAKIFTQHVYPQIAQKIQYASQQNLIDLVAGLTGLQIYDKAVWGTVLGALKNKKFENEFQSVEYHGWELNTYESPSGNSSLGRNLGNHTINHYNSLVTGGGASDLKRKVQQGWDYVFYRFLNPFFFRENRPVETLYTIDYEADKQTFRENLTQASSKVPEVKQVLQDIQIRANI